ncbi:hypothetical protein [Deinococcus radiotolerans]|nr:hypothetical protein [Deinococcus radiotolerans]
MNTVTGYYECAYDGYSTDPNTQSAPAEVPATTQDAPAPTDTE